MHHRTSRGSARIGEQRLGAVLSATLLAALTPFSMAIADSYDTPESQFSAKAFATIRSCSDAPVSGFATLKERASDEGIKQIDVYMQVRGLGGNDRAVHIHETAACEPCGAAGGHFDPGNFGKIDPDANHPFHLGDLVNLEVRGERGTMRTRTSRVTLSPGPLSLFDDDGSAFIVHVNEDSYCTGGEVAGCAGGARAACGIIRKMDATDDFELYVSTSSERKRATELAGAELTDKAYIFLSPIFPRADVESVDFFLDGRQIAREGSAPYDLGGSRSKDKARSVDAEDLDDGTYVLSAVIELASGKRAYVSSEFTIDNDKKRFLNGSENH